MNAHSGTAMVDRQNVIDRDLIIGCCWSEVDIGVVPLIAPGADSVPHR